MKGDKNSESYVKLEKYINKINVESVIKSLMFGVTVGFAVAFIFSFIGWLAGLTCWWVALIIFALVTAGVTPLAYYKKFKPDLKELAKRLDALGLEERVITMLGLEGCDTVMAARQQQSTVTALGGVTTKMLPVVISVLGCVALALSTVLGAGMVTWHALTVEGVALTPDDIGNVINPDPEVYYVLRYELVYLDGNGLEIAGDGSAEIIGNDEQIVLEGLDGELVSVVIEEDNSPDAEYGWQFLGWYNEKDFSKELEEITFELDFQDLAVDSNINGIIVNEDGENVITRYAVVWQVPLEEPDGEGDGDPSDESEEQDDAEDKPSDDKAQGDSDDDENQDPSDSAGGGKYDPGNQIIDGNEYYRDHLDDYKREYQEYLEKGGEIPDYLKKFIETYYEIIK